jgi:hypothetical protein
MIESHRPTAMFAHIVRQPAEGRSQHQQDRAGDAAVERTRDISLR